jgi:hypothetical protein
MHGKSSARCLTATSLRLGMVAAAASHQTGRARLGRNAIGYAPSSWRCMLSPACKLAMARGLHKQTASRSLGALLGLDLGDEDHLDEAMDLAAEPARRIEGPSPGAICKREPWCSMMSPRLTSKAGAAR